MKNDWKLKHIHITGIDYIFPLVGCEWINLSVYDKCI